MSNRLTKGRALVGDIKTKYGNPELVFSATVARTDTTAKTLFTLPASFTITGLTIYSSAASNAATTATLSVGKSGGTGSEYLSSLDVKGSTGSGQQNPTGGVLGGVGTSSVVVTGTYAETGTASTSGGPWTVTIRGTTK